MTLPSWLVLVSPAVAILIALWGFRRSTRADKLRAFFEMQSRYLSSEVRAGRRLIHQKIAGCSPEEVSTLDRTTLDTIGYALAMMNSIAIACDAGYVEEKLLERSMARSFAQAINSACPYIDHVEQIRGFRPYPFAEQLAKRLLVTDQRMITRQRDSGAGTRPITISPCDGPGFESDDRVAQS